MNLEPELMLTDSDTLEGTIIISNPKYLKDLCTKSQRETIDRLRLANRIYYDTFLVKVSEMVGREISSLGKLTKIEASEVIKWLRTPNP